MQQCIVTVVTSLLTVTLSNRRLMKSPIIPSSDQHRSTVCKVSYIVFPWLCILVFRTSQYWLVPLYIYKICYTPPPSLPPLPKLIFHPRRQVSLGTVELKVVFCCLRLETEIYKCLQRLNLSKYSSILQLLCGKYDRSHAGIGKKVTNWRL